MKITTKIKKTIAAALIAATTFVGLSAAGAPVAHAAEDVKFCFDWAAGADYANQPVYLYEWSPTVGRWVYSRSGSTGAAGCGVFSRTDTSKYYIVRAYTYFGDSNMGYAVYDAWALRFAAPGLGRGDIGTATVPLTQCYQGLYRYCNNMA